MTILHSYCAQTKVDYSKYEPQLLRGVLRIFTDTVDKVLQAAWYCLNNVTKVAHC